MLEHEPTVEHIKEYGKKCDDATKHQIDDTIQFWDDVREKITTRARLVHRLKAPSKKVSEELDDSQRWVSEKEKALKHLPVLTGTQKDVIERKQELQVRNVGC